MLPVMRSCDKCGFDKEISDFKKDSRKLNGVSNICKSCASENSKVYYMKTREYRSDANRIKSAKYRKNNIEKLKATEKIYRENNREKIKTKSKLYRESNKSRRNSQIQKRLKVDVLFRFKILIRSMMRRCFVNMNLKKSNKTEDILCLSIENFKVYLESKFEPWMSWDNYGIYNGELKHGWDIDHITPLASDKTEEDVIKLNHYTNLQPLCSYLNRCVKKDSLL